MKVVELADFEARAGEILRQVAEQGEAVEVTDRGRVVAHVVPSAPAERGPVSREEWVARMNAASAVISAHWPPGVSAVEAVREQRREL